MRRLLLLCFALLFALGAHAQERVVSGKVTSSEDGSPVPGANVVLKGTTNGTVTDATGVYKLTVPASGGTLVISFIGMLTIEEVIGDRSTVDGSLGTDVKQLSEVVITALGEKVDKDKFGSAVSTVQGGSIAKSGETSVLTGLSGKAAGVLITRSGGDPGAGAYIQIRGQNTINGNSQPLIVIDGIPMSNSSEGTAAVMQQSRLNDLAPEDIESMEVLKGASAAALWGTRAANGVIMISTKKGKDTNGKLNVEFKSTFSLDKINKMHPLQTAYGQGTGGRYNMNTTRSWGDKIADRTGGADTYITGPGQYHTFDADGEEVDSYAGYVTFPDGTVRYAVPSGGSYAADGTQLGVHGGKNSRDTYDHTKDVFQNGHYLDNSLGISGGNAKSNFYLGLSNLSQEGIIKSNSDYKKSGVRFNVSNQLTDWLRVSVNSNYINMTSNRVQQGDNVDGLLLGMLRTPGDFTNEYNTGTYTDLSGSNQLGRHISFRNPLGANKNPGFANPIWNVYNIENTTNVDRILGNVELAVNPTDWLTITGRSGIDNFVDSRVYDFPEYSATYDLGHLDKQQIIERQFNNDLFARASHQVNPNFSISGVLGVNYNNRYKETVTSSLNDYIIPAAPPLLGNGLNKNLTSSNESSLIRTYAYYAQFNFELMDMFFVELTGRNESASTFGSQAKGSFFFPSATLAWQFTKLEALQNNSVLSFGKLRASYGEVGIQPTPYLTSTTFNVSNYGDSYASALVGSSDSYLGGYSRSNTYGNPTLKPERKSEIEIGTDLRFFSDRLSLGLTVYKNDTKDVILQLSTSPSAGYSSQWQNAAHLRNKGLEIEAGYDVINKGDFSWKISANYSLNRNTVISLAGSDAQYITGAYESALIEGQPFGVFYDVDFVKDESGAYELNANGFPVGGSTPEVIGNSNPKWRAGITNAFTYKGFTLEALFDAVYGNDVWSGARGALYNYGTHADIGKESVSDVPLKTSTGSVIPAGTPFRGNIKDFGAGPVALTESWYNGGGGGGFDGASVKQFVQDGSLIRLRQISLNYKLNSQSFRNATKLNSIDFGFTGRNLGLWTDYVGVDPESNQTQAGSQARGEDWFTNPSTKSYIFSIRVTY